MDSATQCAWLCASLALILTVVALAQPSPRVVQIDHAANSSVKVRARSDAALPPMAPLWWDVHEGAYMIGLKIGAGYVELVFDTGSSNISAKGPGCQWTTCTPTSGQSEQCTTQQCPCGLDEQGRPRKDCASYYYTPRGRFLRPGEDGVNTQTKLTYGSQEDTVEHYKDSVSVPYAPAGVTCANLATHVPSGPLRGGGSSGELVRHDVLVHRVTHTKGTSSSNLFGLAPPGRHGPVVLNALFDSDKPMIWSLVLRPPGGWWALGALPCFTDVQYMPLIRTPAFDQFITRFYVVDLLWVEVGPTLGSMRRVSRAKTPRYCIPDTGTTYTYTAPRFGSAMDRMGYDERTWYVRLALGDANSPIILTYSADSLKDPENTSASVLQVSPGRTLDNFEQLFPNVDVMLLGAIMMQHCYWEFDVTGHRLGVQCLSE